jgi:hypothetical protein
MTRRSIPRAIRHGLIALLSIASLAPHSATAQGTDTTASRPTASRPTTPRAARPADSTKRTIDTTKRIVDRPRANRSGGDSANRSVDAIVRIRIDAPGSPTRIDSASSNEAAQVEWGKGQIAPGDTIHGDLVNLFGDVDVRGVVLGDAVTLLGDLTVHENAIVEGDAVSVLGDLTLKNGSIVRHDAVAVRGEVAVLGGTVEGSIVSGTGQRGSWSTDEEAESPEEPMSRGGALLALLITAAVLAISGIVATAAFPARLDGIARRLEAGVGRAFAAGLLLELGFVPLLLLLLFGLVITLIGILLIPFALIAYAALYGVMGMLGWFAVAILVGRGVSGADGAERRDLMRALSIGTVILLLPYALVALVPASGELLSALAACVTWVVVTAGFGAAVLSRAGKPRAAAPSFWPSTPSTPPAPPAPPEPPATID